MNVKRGATKKRGIMKKRGSRHLLISSSLIVLIFLGLIAVFYFSGLSDKFTFTGFAVQEGMNTSVITINPNQEIGRVREDFYGVGLQSPKLVSGTITLPNGTVVKRNYTWQQQTYLNNGAKISYYDANLQEYYSNTNDSSGVNMTSYLTDFINQLNWDYQNNITSVIIMDYMPDWLADNSSGNCLSLSRCPPSNYTKWNNIVIDFYKRVDQYRNITYVQIWNEPDGSFFEANLPMNSAKTDFVILFNSTYNAFKNYNSSIIIAGYRGLAYSVTTSELSNFTKMMLSNLSDEFEIFSYNPYSDSYINSNSISSEIDYLLTQCDYYNATCNRIFLSEWQPTSITLKNQSLGQSSEYRANIAYFLQDLLNNYPDIISQFPYHWDDSVSYFNNPENYIEYPSFWSSVSEAGLDNPEPTYYPVYNISKNFAHYHGAGSTIINSSSNNKNISVVVSKNNSALHVTLINIAKNNISVDINLSLTGAEAIKDLATGQVYNAVSGIASVGILEPYDVKHYENSSRVEIPENTAGSSNSDNQEKIKKVVKNEDKIVVINNNSAQDIKEETISEEPKNLSEENNTSNSNEYNAPISGGATLDLNLEENPGYVYIIIILIGSVILLGIVIYIVSKRKKCVKKLDDWINRAFSLGYNSKQIQEMLEKSKYNKKLIAKIIRRYT